MILGSRSAHAEPPPRITDATSDWPVHLDPLPPAARAPTLAAGPRTSYADAMATCDGIAVAGPLVLTAVFGASQLALYGLAKVDTTFPAEPRFVAGAFGVSGVGYVVCGPATHLAHGHVGRAATSLLVRTGLPVAAVGLTTLFLAMALSSGSSTQGGGDGFGPSAAGVTVVLLGGAGIVGSFAGALAIDYGLAAQPTVLPVLTPVAGGFTAGLSARW